MLQPRKAPRFLCGCDMKARYRCWRMIIWPDSAPHNWQSLLMQHCIPFVISPLHQSDPDSVLEDERKPHYHVVFFFDGQKSFSQVDPIALELNAPMPLPSNSARGSVRYLIHADQPDKPQYPISSIRAFFGAEVSQYFTLSYFQEIQDSKSLFQYIADNNFTEYAHLLDDLRIKGLDEWYIFVTKQMTIAVKAYIASRRHMSGGRSND